MMNTTSNKPRMSAHNRKRALARIYRELVYIRSKTPTDISMQTFISQARDWVKKAVELK